MREITYRQALNEALAEEIARDPNVFLMGEEVAEYNGAYKVSQGLLDRFGPTRIIDTPISENGFAGLGIGAAMVGLRPIIEFMTFSFSFVAFDQIVNNAPNMLTMSGGQFNVPITFRGPNGPAHQLGATHSHATECLYANVPGLKICAPATPRDAKGLLKTAVRDNNPVLVLECELFYSHKGLVEPEDHELLIPLGEAEIKREGSDVTIVSYAQTVPMALAAAEKLAEEKINAEVIDLRSIKPLDWPAVFQSVTKTHRIVIAEQDRPFCGIGAEIAYRVQREIFDTLDAPIMRVSQEDVPMPYNERLEHAVLPNTEKIIAAVKKFVRQPPSLSIMPEIDMPKLSDTMTEGTLVSWKKKIGDEVIAGEVLAEIETDKATMEWEATEGGVLKEIYVPEGGKVNVGDRIAFIGGGVDEVPDDSIKDEEVGGEGGEIERMEAGEPENVPVKRKAKPVEAGVSPAPFQAKSSSKALPTQQEREHRVKASPLARKLAVEREIDLTRVKGTGPGGRIVEKDVAATVSAAFRGAPGSGIPAKQKSPTPEIYAGETARISLTGMRRVIAERLVSSLGPVPHFYLNIEINADALMRVRAELKAGGEDDDATKITVNDFILKGAVVAALREPKVNVAFDGDAIIHYGDVNLAVAVAIDEGLVTPVIRAAQDKSLREISTAVKDLAYRARNKRMKPDEFQGGTLTVSNLGNYGIDYFSAIINPPQAIILSVGAIVRQPIVSDAGAIVPGYRMKIGMSCDHRAVDGAIGADYLKTLRHLLENPSLLLL